MNIGDLNPALNQQNSTLTEFDPSSLPKKEKEEPVNVDPLQQGYDSIDRKTEQLRELAIKRIEENNARIEAERLATELEQNTTLTESPADVISSDTYHTQQEIAVVKDEVIDTEVVSETEIQHEEKIAEDELADLRIEKLKGLLKDKIQPVKEKIDLTTFTINKKSSNVFKLFDLEKVKDTFISDWLLPSSNTLVSMKEFKGTEINALDPRNSSRTPLNTARDILQLIWSHITNTNKPPFETWLKVTKFADLEHLYFAVYKSSFDGTNTIPYYCTADECNEVFIHDVDIMDMIKFKNDKDKELYLKALTNARDSHVEEEHHGLEMEVVQISDDFAFGLKDATLFSVQIEPQYLTENFRKDNIDIISIIMYLEDIYYINREENSLDEVNYKEYPDSVAKTVASKYKTYIEIIKNLNSDQLYTLQTLISNIAQKNIEMTYVLPGQVCPKCGKTIEEEESEASQILFTRRQLAVLANS